MSSGPYIEEKRQQVHLRRDNFDFLKDLLGGIPWLRALESKGAQKNRLTFKYHFSQSKKSGKSGRRSRWMSKEIKLRDKLKWKKKVKGMWKRDLAYS